MTEKPKHKELVEELEHDELREDAEVALAFIKKHRNAVMNVAIAVLVLVVLFSYSRGAKSRAIMDSNRQLAQALVGVDKAEELGAGAEARAVVVAELTRVAKTFPKLRAGQSAQLHLAGMLFDSGDWDGAKAEFESIARDFSQDPFVPVALEGSALCLEAKGEYEAAIKALGEARQAHPDAFNGLEMRLDEARCLEALGRADEAVAIYEEVAKDYPNTDYERLAAERVKTLKPAPPLAQMTPSPATPASEAAPAKGGVGGS